MVVTASAIGTEILFESSPTDSSIYKQVNLSQLSAFAFLSA